MIASLRARRAAFWYLATDRIVAAVVSRGEREPLLEACAASYASPVAGSSFAPGVVEVSWVLGCQDLANVAALAGAFCRVEAAEAGAEAVRRRDPAPGGNVAERDSGAASRQRAGETLQRRAGAVAGETSRERAGAVTGADGVRVWADEAAVAEAAGLFRRSRLRLVALDCEPCALASLAEVLGASDAAAARRQHLSAVSVLAEAETAAEALGDDLAVPVGLAVAWFGVGHAR
jgi:hypothetical protein